MRQAACCFSLGKPLQRGLSSRCVAPRSRPVLPAAARALRQAAQAAQAEGREGGGGGGVRRQRESVTFLAPSRADPDRHQTLRSTHVTQSSLNRFLHRMGAVGFELPDGSFTDLLEHLPEGGTVRLVMPSCYYDYEPPQVRNLQEGYDNETLAKQQRLAAFLRQLASKDNAGGSLTTLQAEPFKTASGQDYVQLDAAVVAGSTLYLGELKRMVGEDSVADLVVKFTKIRNALSRGNSPNLTAALRGVTGVKLFLAGEGVQAGLSVEELVELTAAQGMGLVLSFGQGLGLVRAAPAVPL